MASPWDAFPAVGQQPAQAPQPEYPGVIQGRPKAVDPMQQQKDALDIAIKQQTIAENERQAAEDASKDKADAPRERLARIKTSLENLRQLEAMVSGSDMGTGSIVGQESFRAGEDFMGMSKYFNQTANDVAGSIEMVQGDLINQVRNEMQEQGAPIGVRGADTEKEASRLAASIANLAQTQDEAQFIGGIQRAREYYIRRLAANFRALRESGEDIPVTQILDDMLKSGATQSELVAIGQALGVEINEDDLAANIRSRDAGGPTNTFTPLPPDGENRYVTGLKQGTGDVVEGMAALPGMIINPIGQQLYNITGYGDQTYDLGDILREAIGLPESDPGVGRSIRQGAAGALTGAGVARAASNLVTGPITRNVLATVGRTPLRDTAAGAGAGAGAEIGQEVGGTPGQIAGTVAGGLAGYGGANALARAATPRTANALAQASTRQGVDLLPADAGGPVAKAVTTGTKASPVSVGPVVKQAQRQQDQFGQAVQRTAGKEGEVLPTDAAGDTVRRAAQNFTKQTAERGSRMYDRAANMAKGVKAIRPSRTIEAVDAAIARMEANPAAESGSLNQLRAFREKIADGVSIQGLRDARTSLSQGVYNGNLRGSSEQKMWKDILSNVSDDIDAGLRSVGRDDAANAFRTADRFWSERVEYIDKVLQPIIGKDGVKSGEDILKAVETMARGGQGGNARLSRLLAGMSEQEAGNVRATLVDRLGRSTPGAQDAAGGSFSASTFLTNWNKMTPQAKASLFGDSQMRSDLNDLAKLAEGMKASQAMSNFSNTAIGIGGNIGIQGTVAMADATLAGSLLAAQYATGRLMASPKFARILARTTKLPPEVANRKLSEQLGILAGQEPALASDIRSLQQAMNDNMARPLAAEEPTE